MPAYPPYQHPFLDPQTRLVTKPWQLFFLHLATEAATFTNLTLGTGLMQTDTTLAVDAVAVATLGYWTPLTNGDPLSPEILFDAEGDCVVGFVPTP